VKKQTLYQLSKMGGSGCPKYYKHTYTIKNPDYGPFEDDGYLCTTDKDLANRLHMTEIGSGRKIVFSKNGKAVAL
jgi:hypothetical protein